MIRTIMKKKNMSILIKLRTLIVHCLELFDFFSLSHDRKNNYQLAKLKTQKSIEKLCRGNPNKHLKSKDS